MDASARATRYLLRTFGAPSLVCRDGSSLPGVRRKDLALLVYLRLERRAHSRSTLTSLLWDGAEEPARHSLCQAVVRLRSALGAGAVIAERDRVELHDELPCDAPSLEDPRPDTELLTAIVTLGPDQFLAHFELGPGAHDFHLWADEKRAELRRWLVRHLDRRSEEAERDGRFADARELAQQLTRIEPFYEEGHRRVMRAWSALGERVLALRQYQQLSALLAAECGERPDPTTRRLAELLRHRASGESRVAAVQGTTACSLGE